MIARTSPKECAACGWGASVGLTIKTCPSCQLEKYYCSDCHAAGKAFNCGECQLSSSEEPDYDSE